MDLKTRHSTYLSLTLSVFLLGFCALIYVEVRHRLENAAEQTLIAFLDHEWRHVEHKGGDVSAPSNTLQHNEIFYQLKEGERVVFSSLPPAFSEGRGIIRTMNRQLAGSEFSLKGYYDLTAIRESLAALARVLALGSLLAVLLTAPLSWLTIRSLLAPFRRFAERARELDAGMLQFRFPEPREKDEYGLLVRSFNSLAGRLERSFAQMRRFAMNASHELRTPLTILRGEAELLLRRPRPQAEYEAGLLGIAGQAETLQALIARLLFLAEVERRPSAEPAGPLEIRPFLDKSVEALRKLNGAEHAKVRLETGGSPTVVGHAELLTSIMNNLVDNAIKFAHEKVEIHADAAPGEFRFLVDDDGPGIAPEVREAVLEPLNQARPLPADSQSLDAPAKGARRSSNGLGLAIVRSCVEAMRGSLRFCDSPLGGLRVEVRLPQSS